ncbi:MAG: hypothetical protein QOC56_2901 [Alphaproteobacteria bacterium]|nr:hypothetical protein [Alphaproteobacteria bacterium]
MNAAVLGGLVEQWVWRCELIATQYQLKPSTDLQLEVGKVVEQAEWQARQLEANGSLFLARIEGRLALTAHVATTAGPLYSDPVTERMLNAAGRAEALRALAAAFGIAGDRLDAFPA